MALDAVILDVDGTLIDSNDLHIEAWIVAFAARDYKISADRIAVEIGKGGDNLVPSILGVAADKKDGTFLREQQPREFLRLAKGDGLRVFPGVTELLVAFRQRGLKIIIATSSGQEQLDTLTRYSGLDLRREADELVTSDDTARSKPAPDLVATAVDRAGLSPAQCAMIGDTPYDAQSAKHAGVITVGLTCGGQNTSQTLFNAGSRCVYDSPADLLAHLDEALGRVSPCRIHLTQSRLDEFMREALQAARDGVVAGEAPIGAVLVNGDGVIVGRGWNQQNETGNRAAHAELTTLANAARRIPPDARDHILVCTLEPCVMCTGAAMETAIDTIAFGLAAPADSGTGRVMPPSSPESQMPRITAILHADECLELWEQWYAANRNRPQAEYATSAPPIAPCNGVMGIETGRGSPPPQGRHEDRPPVM